MRNSCMEDYEMNSITNNRKNNNKIYLMVLLFIFSVYLDNFYLNIGFSLKPFMIVVGIILLFSLKGFVVHKLMNYELAMILFYIYYCSTGLFAMYPTESFRLIIAILIVLTTYFVMKYLFSRISISQLENSISTVGIFYNGTSLILYIIGLISVNFNFHGNAVITYGLLLDRNTPRLIGLSSDPNIYIFSNILFFFFYLSRIKMGIKYTIVGLLLTVITCILTLSRGGLLALALGLLIYFLFMKLSAKFGAIMISTITGFFAYFTILKLTNINILSTLFLRFDLLLSDGGSGRVSIWENGWKLFVENPLTGIGIYNFLGYNTSIFGDKHYMHNTYLEVLTESGIIGFVLFFVFWFLLFKKIIFNVRKDKTKHFLLPSLISISVLLMSLSLIANVFLFLYFTVFWRYLSNRDIISSS